MADHHVRGGLARAAVLSPEERSAIASRAAQTRWGGADREPRTPSLKVTIARIERHKAAIGKHRDALRDILDDLEGVVESTEGAVRLLDDAVTQLSELL